MASITCGSCFGTHASVDRVKDCYAMGFDFEAEAALESHGAAFCDNYMVHDGHYYTAINSEVYHCSGFTEEDAQELAAQAEAAPCEHGLSAALCAGPMHYPADNMAWA